MNKSQCYKCYENNLKNKGRGNGDVISRKTDKKNASVEQNNVSKINKNGKGDGVDYHISNKRRLEGNEEVEVRQLKF